MSRNGKKDSYELDTSGLPALPKGWCWATVADVADVQGGIQKQPKRKPAENAHSYLRVANVLRNRLDLSEVHEMELFGDELERLRLLKGDLLVVEGNGSRTEIGRSALWNGAIDDCVHQNHIIRVRFLAGAPEFLNYYWNSPEGNQRVTDASASTSGLYTLSVAKVFGFPVPLAPIAEQKRIASKVDELFSDLDAGVAALERVKANLKRYRATVLKAAVEGRLTEEWRKKNRPKETGQQLLDRILKERRRKWEEEQLAAYAKAGKTPPAKWKDKYKEPTGVEDTNLPALPEGWCWATVEQLCFLDVGFAFKSVEFTDCGIRLLRGENIEPGALRWQDVRFWSKDRLCGFENLLLNEGEIVLAMDRPLVSSGLKLARVQAQDLPCLLVQRMARFRMLDLRTVAYVYSSLQTQPFIKHLLAGQTGTQLPHISGSGIVSYVMPLPSLEEQAAISAEVEKRLSVVEEIEAQTAANLKRSTRLRQAILKQAFDGKLVAQDPGDTPAEKLLASIQLRRESSKRLPPKERMGCAKASSGE